MKYNILFFNMIFIFKMLFHTRKKKVKFDSHLVFSHTQIRFLMIMSLENIDLFLFCIYMHFNRCLEIKDVGNVL